MPTPDFGSELSGLDFDNIIGGPLTAVIEAQAQAAETSIGFINDIGLQYDEGELKPVMATFSYFKDSQDVEGNINRRKHRLQVPVLAIVPIPFMTFDDVWLNFKVNLNSIESRSKDRNTKLNVSGRAGFGPVRIKAAYAKQWTRKDVGQLSRSYGMNVQVHAVQDAMPEGMERVLNILEQVATAEVNPYNAIKAIEQITQTTAFEPDVTLEGVGQINTVSQTDDAGLATKGAGYNYTKSFYFDLSDSNGSGARVRVDVPNTWVSDANGDPEFAGLNHVIVSKGSGFNAGTGSATGDADASNVNYDTLLWDFEWEANADGEITKINEISNIADVIAGLCVSANSNTDGGPMNVFSNVPLYSGSGGGVGAQAATIIINHSDGTLDITLDSNASTSGYMEGDVLGVDNQFLGGNGGGATVRVTDTDHLPTYHERVIICDAAGGEGYGAKFRVTVPGVENPVVTQANIELVDGGRDYAASTLITIANPSGPGAVEAKIGRVG